MNKWLGLVMFVPLFNVVLMALLAFGSESAGPSVSVKPIVGRAIAAYVLACVVLCGGLYLYVLPMMEDVFSATAKMQHFVFPGGPQQVPGGKTPATAVPQPATAQPQTLKTPAATAAAPAVRLDKAYYDALLQRKPPNFSDDSFEQGRPETCVGPACILLSNFWKQQDPHVWLKVRIADIPYMTMLDSSKMIITDVHDTSGKNVYDVKSSFETGSFLTLRFMAHSGGYLEAIRDVHLLPGVQEADLKSVHGEIDFQFPMNVQSAEFRVQDAGQAKTAAGVRITLEKLEGNTAKIQAAGDIDRFIGVKAFDSSGKELESGSSSSMTSENGKSASYTFQGQVATLTAYVAEKILHKNYVVSLEVK